MESKINTLNYFEKKIIKSEEYLNFDFGDDEYIVVFKNIDKNIIEAIHNEDYTISKFIEEFFPKNGITKERILKYTERYFKSNLLNVELKRIDFIKSASSNIKRVIYSLVKEPVISKELSRIVEIIYNDFNFDDYQIVNIEVDSDIFYEVNELLNKTKNYKDLEVEFLPFPKEKVKGNTNIHLDLVNNGVNFLDLKVSNKARFSTGITILVKMSSLIEEIKDKLEFIFNDNVRYYVKDSRVDNSIIQSLINNPNDFHILHNGISIVCDNCDLIKDTINMDAAQIINGAQTIYNVVKVFKYGLMDKETINDVLIMVKVLVIESKGENKITKKDISLAANTQKRIFQYDLSSNSDYVRAYRDYFGLNNIELLTKRGEKRSVNSIQIDKLVKVLVGCIEQIPHKARNESIEKFFDENYLMRIFPVVEENQDFYLSSRLLIAKIYLDWLHFKRSATITPLLKYGEKMAISYAFYEIVQSKLSIIIKKDKIEYDSVAKDIALNSFMKLSEDSRINKWTINDFRSESSYSQYFENISVTKNDFRGYFIPKIND